MLFQDSHSSASTAIVFQLNIVYQLTIYGLYGIIHLLEN